VFSRGAKFSLFKPAEEMVYIGLDDESRTKGKAAIDVVGAQSGKSIGSVLQQALLILSGGTLGGILPLLAVFYAVMLRSWTRAVDDLAEHYDPSHVHRVSVAGSLDEEDEAAAAAASGGPTAAPPGRTPAPAC
jgi:AAA family ATP:ADP antiporter